jgi:hypothetical protein
MTNAFETLVLQHVFQNSDIANIGDAAGLQNSATEGSLYIALCTSATVPDDATAGTAATYSPYARIAVARSAVGWTVSGNQVSNAAAVVFATCASGSDTIRYYEIYTAASGGTRLYWTQLTSDLAVGVGVAPTFAIGALAITYD